MELLAKALASGQSTGTIVIDFLTSPEYTALHPDNISYVRALYTEVLQRPADSIRSEEVAFWVTALDSGSRTRAAVGFYFLASDASYDLAINQFYREFLQAYRREPREAAVARETG